MAHILHPLKSNFSIKVTQPPRFDPLFDKKIDEVWERDGGNYEEFCFFSKTFSESHLEGFYLPYRYLFGVTMRGELAKQIPFPPVGISGVTTTLDSLLVGRRGEGVCQYKGYLELPPSGALSEKEPHSKKSLDPLEHLRRELHEETGIKDVVEITPLFVAQEVELNRLDLCFHLLVKESTPLKTGSEYPELKWVLKGDPILNFSYLKKGNQILSSERSKEGDHSLNSECLKWVPLSILLLNQLK